MIFFKTAASRVTDWLVAGGSIPRENREIYEYGLDKLFSMIMSFLFAALLGAVVGVALPAIVFFAAYFVLRVSAGGYHADTPMRCFFISIGIMIPPLLAIRYYPVWYSPIVYIALLLMGAAIIVWLAPVENKNKLLDDLEKKVYRRRTLICLAATSGFSVMLLMFSIHKYSIAVLFGILLAAAMAVAGKIKLSYQRSNGNQ